MSMQVAADGSSLRDAPQRVTVDRTNSVERMRYVCPNGHTTWDRTNNHIWCPACARAAQHDDDVDAEHYEIRDKKTGRLIPWSAVELDEE